MTRVGGSGTAAVVEKLREFERVASLLNMPREERLGILNVTEAAYLTLRNGLSNFGTGPKPELERRLTYALPLMRRLAGELSMRATQERIYGSTSTADS